MWVCLTLGTQLGMSGVDDDELIGMCLTSWHKLGYLIQPPSDTSGLHTVAKKRNAA